MSKVYCDIVDRYIELNQRMAAEFDRISTVVGKEGKIAQRATIGNVEGSWAANERSHFGNQPGNSTIAPCYCCCATEFPITDRPLSITYYR